MNSDDIGNLGEAELKKWCALNGITANKSLDDKKGWDYIIQFPAQNIETPNFECFVQVKTSLSTESKIQIKLSNWKNLSTTSIPSFVLIPIFENNNPNPIQVGIYHVNASMINKTLTWLRKLRIQKRTNRINQMSFNVPKREIEYLKEPFHSSFLNYIKSEVKDQMEYVTKKITKIKLSGNPLKRLIFRGIVPENSPVDIADWILGLKELKVESIEEIESRFEVEESKGIRKVDKRISNPTDNHYNIDLVLVNSATKESTKVPVVLRTAKVPDILKIFIEGKSVTLTYQVSEKHGTNGKITHKGIRLDKEYILDDIIPILQFEYLANQIASTTKIAEYYLNDYNDKTFLFKSLNTKYELNQVRKKCIEILFQFQKILEKMKIERKIKIKPTVLIQADSIIENIYNMLFNEYIYTAKFDPTSEIPKSFDVPISRSINTGYDEMIIIGLVEFSEQSDSNICECCGWIKHYSTDFKIHVAKTIPNTNNKGLFKKLQEEVLSNKSNKLIYDNSLNNFEIMDSLVSSNKFSLDF